jgi:putative addiction module component (TIGR02574 family)
MHRTLQELETEALKLPVEARGELTTRLLDSLELSETEIQERWVREAERRAEEMRSGQVVGEPVGEVLARIRAKLG